MTEKRKIIRVYAETSVFGGIGDVEFKKASLTFFEQVSAGKFSLVSSAIVRDECNKAPKEIFSFFEEITATSELAKITPEADSLKSAYLKAKIIPDKWEMDALHVALATVADCAIIISWNFKHIVNYRKIPLYNAINLTEGYKAIAIYSPSEVIEDEN